MSSTSQLTVRGVCRQYDPPGGRLVLKDVNLDAGGMDARTVAIVGPSGSGKSTLLNIIGALDHADGGTVHVDDLVVTALEGDAAARFRAQTVGFVFQDHHLLPQLTAAENVLLPTLALPRARRDRTRAKELLRRVGIADRADAFPSQLSGGERQRVAIARALINAPRLLLCDEPTGNLDHDNALRVVDLFGELAKDHAVLVLMVTHNLELAARFERRLRLIDGQLAPVDAIGVPHTGGLSP